MRHPARRPLPRLTLVAPWRRLRLLLFLVAAVVAGVSGATRPAHLSAAPASGVPAQGAGGPLRAPAVLAKSAYLLDVTAGVPLFQKFPAERRQMASTAKLMTGLIVAESGRLEELAPVSRRAAAVGETSMGLAEGDRVPVLDLLYGLLLNSGNDAAIALAEHFSGSVEAFVERMNARGAALGLADTRFATPHGLDHAQFRQLAQHGSARDLALLGAAAIANPTLARAAGTTMRDVPRGAGKAPYRLRHTVSAVWWYPGALGGKTGWTERAGHVRVIAAERAGRRLVVVVMDSPDHVRETRDLLDYGFATASGAPARADVQRGAPLPVAAPAAAPAPGAVPLVPPLVPTSPDAFPAPPPQLQAAWERYKAVALAPEGRVRQGPAGAGGAAGGGGVRGASGPGGAADSLPGATADAQAAALLHAVWFRDRTAFDAIWSWTREALSRRQPHPDNPYRDALFAGRWSGGSVTDWANSTAADQRLGAALLLASRLWNEPAYAAEAKTVLDAVLNRAAVSWQNTGVPAPTLSIPAANSFLKEMEPVTTSAASLTLAFYRMFAEGTRNAVWLSALDGAYLSLERATGTTASVATGAASAAAAAGPLGAAGATSGTGTGGTGGPLGAGVGLLPSWFSVARDGAVGAPVDPSWQSTGFGPESPPLAWQLALDLRWHGERRAQALLAPAARTLGRDLTQRRQIAAAYARAGSAAPGPETARYGALAGIALPELDPALRAKLESQLGAADPERILDAIDGLWLLAGGPPDFWRLWWPPENLPTTRNDAVVPPSPAAGIPWRYFEQTGHVVQGPFLEFFSAHGGVDVFGYPRTGELVEDGRTVQWFQRARLEAPLPPAGPGAAAAPSAGQASGQPAGGVVPTPLGRRAALARGALSSPAAQPLPPPTEDDPASLYVPETGHRLGGGFRDFYARAGGGVALGPPLTEELQEDGVTVQYFERAVLEYVPGQPVRPTLLGDALLRERGWLK